MTEQEQEFLLRIEAGETIEAMDWMPEDYRHLLVKFIEMHAVSEVMGAYPEKEWVPKAPNLRRKLSMMAKVQDEIGHGQLLMRIAEDVGKPLGYTREMIMNRLIEGRSKFHNVFHVSAPSWGDAAIIGWLVDGAAIMSQTALLNTSYGPYARMLKRICAEESFHMHHGESLVFALAMGSKMQRDQLQDALNRWWDALMFFFGPKGMSDSAAKMVAYRLRTQTNEELRQKFLSRYVPRILKLGLTIPDSAIRYDETSDEWTYSEPDWRAWENIVRANAGEASQSRIELRRRAHEDYAWFRKALSEAEESNEGVHAR